MQSNMKTEDIDKKIGMPDVDKEWARFEQEVIDPHQQPPSMGRLSAAKNSPPRGRWRGVGGLLGIGIAASVALLIIYNIGKTQTEQPLVAQVEPTQPQHVSEPARVPAKEVVAEVSKPVATPRKELALAKADAPATTGLDIPAREFTGAVQKPKEDGLGSGTTMRLRGTGDGPSDKDRIDSTLILINGEPLPEHLKQEVLGNNPDDLDTYMPRYFSQQGLLIDSVYVLKDSEFTEKYGGLAKYGVIEIKTVPDTYCDAYVRKHPKLMKKYQRVEGYVFDNNGKPLTEAWVHVKRERAVLKKHPELDLAGAATDSTGHYVLWLPKDADIMLCAEQAGYKSFEFSPSDKDIVTHHLEKTYNMRLQGAQEELLAALPDFVPDENEVRLLPLGAIGGSHDSPPNDSILYLINGVPQPKENNKWLDKRSYLDYFKGQHLLVSRVMDYKNVKQRYIEKYGEAAKHGVIEYICVEDTLCDYYMDQHEELKASRRRVSGIVYDENDEPLAHTIIYIWHEKRVWGFETTDSLGKFTFWVPRTDVKMEFTYVGFYKAVVVEPSDTFQTIYLLPNDNLKSLRESLKF